MLPDFTIVHHEEIDSTNLEAMRQARLGATEGLVIVADRQSAGRGRHGRTWQSLSGNLLLSLMLRPDCAPDRIAQLSFVTALAVADSVDAVLPNSGVALKWPNDVLLGDAKLCGILIETELDGATVDHVVIGVGVNIAAAPPGFDYQATSLAAHGCACGRDEFAGIFLDAFRKRWQQWAGLDTGSIHQDWVERAWRLGTAIKVDTDAGVVMGRFTGIDPSGALLVDTASGERRILSGRISYGQAA